jgi:hypothetical protein
MVEWKKIVRIPESGSTITPETFDSVPAFVDKDEAEEKLAEKDKELRNLESKGKDLIKKMTELENIGIKKLAEKNKELKAKDEQIKKFCDEKCQSFRCYIGCPFYIEKDAPKPTCETCGDTQYIRESRESGIKPCPDCHPSSEKPKLSDDKVCMHMKYHDEWGCAGCPDRSDQCPVQKPKPSDDRSCQNCGDANCRDIHNRLPNKQKVCDLWKPDGTGKKV